MPDSIGHTAATRARYMTWPRFGALMVFAAAAGGVVGYLVALLDGLITRSDRL